MLFCQVLAQFVLAQFACKGYDDYFMARCGFVYKIKTDRNKFFCSASYISNPVTVLFDTVYVRMQGQYECVL
jgi:hypothetical protein